jgi:hypothetical protein
MIQVHNSAWPSVHVFFLEWYCCVYDLAKNAHLTPSCSDAVDGATGASTLAVDDMELISPETPLFKPEIGIPGCDDEVGSSVFMLFKLSDLIPVEQKQNKRKPK